MSSKRRKKQPILSIRRIIGLLPALVLIGLIAFLGSLSFPRVCANSISCIRDLTAKVENDSKAQFDGKSITPPKIDLSARNVTNVLGENTESNKKHIYVDLGKQKLYAYDGNKLFMEAYVSTGKWNRTPTGDFKIWIKLRATRMSGGQGADYYNLPNVPYVMFFSNSVVSQAAGFSLHGAYWHNNFGHTMSHGCVNMRIVDAEKLYNWATPVSDGNTTRASDDNPGTLVTIYGQAPN